MNAAKLAWFLCVPLVVGAAEVRIGDSVDDVRASLGAPRGQLTVGGRQILHFDRGEVELQGGAVTRVALVTPAEFQAREARRAAEAARLGEETARRNAEGEAVKARRLADPSFLAAPLTYQLEVWRNFAVRYPGVSVAEQFAVLRMRLAEQIAERQSQETRLAELEERVNQAEARADEADSRHYYFGAYGYDDFYRNRHPFTLWPIQYHFDNTPQPIITPYNPNAYYPPTYDQARRAAAAAAANGNVDCDRREGRSFGRHGRM